MAVDIELDSFGIFWIAGAVAIVGIAFAIGTATPSGESGENKEVEFAKAGLEECVKSKSNNYTLWTKDCVRYLQYIEEGKFTPAQAEAKVNAELSPF